MRWLLAAGAILALLLLRPDAPHAWGQTVPLRPTPTVAGQDFQQLPQPTAPTTAVPAPRTASSNTVRPAATVGAATAPTSTAAPATASVVGVTPVSGGAIRVEHAGVPATALPPLPAGWRLAETQLRLSGAPAGVPVTVRPSSRDLAAAGGAPSALLLFRAAPEGPDGQWLPAPRQSPSGQGEPLRFVPDSPGLYVLLARTLPPNGDYSIAGGRFFRLKSDQAGGGYSVVDAGAPFWTAYQRAGGEALLGRPVSRRFMQGNDLAQAFERGGLVARAGAAAPVEVRTTPLSGVSADASTAELAPWPEQL